MSPRPKKKKEQPRDRKGKWKRGRTRPDSSNIDPVERDLMPPEVNMGNGSTSQTSYSESSDSNYRAAMTYATEGRIQYHNDRSEKKVSAKELVPQLFDVTLEEAHAKYPEELKFLVWEAVAKGELELGIELAGNRSREELFGDGRPNPPKPLKMEVTQFVADYHDRPDNPFDELRAKYLQAI